MPGSKAGLADLKRLHQQALEAQRAWQLRDDAEQLARQQALALKQKPVTSPEEVTLFARAMRFVTPILADDRAVHRPSLAAQAAQAELVTQRRQRATGQDGTIALPALSDAFSPFPDDVAELAWLAPGIGPEVLRQLKRAYWPVGAHLDLHNLNSDQAKLALSQFITASQTHGTRCVRIVHGQGFGSAGGQPVLKSRVAQWLTQMTHISAFASAPPAHGGQGALLVLLRH